MKTYYLMNKDDKLLEFKTEELLGATQVTETSSFDRRRPFGFIDIATWIEKRNYAKHKEHFKKWLKEWNLDTVDGFIEGTHGLGINDCFWIKPTSSSLSWDQMNLYHNTFSDVAAHTAFEVGLHGLQLSSTSPEFTSEGSFPKCWRREEGDIKLYKAGMTGASNVGLEPYSEYLSSKLSTNLAKHFTDTLITPYDLVMFKDKLCSVCSLFTGEEVGFAPIYTFLNGNRKYTLADMLRFCSDMGYEKEFRDMILLDSVTFNQDRHLGNFGVLFDTESFEIKGFSPLFDFNISMLCNALSEDLEDYPTYEESYQVGHKLGGTFREVGNQILIPSMKRSLPGKISLPMHELYNLPLKRMDKLAMLVEKNYQSILGNEKSFFLSKGKEEKEEIFLKQ